MESRRNELLADVAANTADTVKDFGVADDVAEQIGAAVADALATNWGGQIISIPKDYFFRLSKRDRAILEQHRQGATYAALAKQHNMSERGIRKLLRRAESRDRNLRQQQLFATEG